MLRLSSFRVSIEDHWGEAEVVSLTVSCNVRLRFSYPARFCVGVVVGPRFRVKGRRQEVTAKSQASAVMSFQWGFHTSAGRGWLGVAGHQTQGWVRAVLPFLSEDAAQTTGEPGSFKLRGTFKRPAGNKRKGCTSTRADGWEPGRATTQSQRSCLGS